jgi:hypothetical protein
MLVGVLVAVFVGMLVGVLVAVFVGTAVSVVATTVCVSCAAQIGKAMVL